MRKVIAAVLLTGAIAFGVAMHGAHARLDFVAAQNALDPGDSIFLSAEGVLEERSRLAM